MYNYGYEEDAIMNLRDSVRGVVSSQSKEGNLYIDMEIEDEDFGGIIKTVPAFGYWCGKVERGTEVLCSIKSWATENKRIKVKVDSVYYEDERAA